MKPWKWIAGILMSAWVAGVPANTGLFDDSFLVTVPAGDVEALRLALQAAHDTGLPVTIKVLGLDPFIFTDLDNTTEGGNFLPPIRSNVSIIHERQALEGVVESGSRGVEFVRAEGAPAGRFLHVLQEGELRIGRVLFENGDSPADGGAVLVEGRLVATGAEFMNNQAQGNGGAIAGRSGSKIRMLGVLVRDNHAAGDGGGVHSSGTLDTFFCGLTNNSADGFGGAVDCSGPGSEAVVEVAALANNTAGVGAGALHANGCNLMMNNTWLSGSSPDGIWASATVDINNSLLLANTPQSCRTFGPLPAGAYNVTDEGSCGLSQNGVSLPASSGLLDAFFEWVDQVRLADDLFNVGIRHDVYDDHNLSGAGSPLSPGAGPGACAPVGINGMPVVPPVAPCTPGPFQMPPEGTVPNNLSGQVFDFNFLGTGINLLHQQDGQARIEWLGFNSAGAADWRSVPGHQAGPFLVAMPGRQPDISVAPLGEMDVSLSSLIIDPVPACGGDVPSQVRMYRGRGAGVDVVELDGIYLTQVVQCPGENPFLEQIQSGHSGGFAATARPFDRYTLFVLLRGQVLFNWMTLDAGGNRTWFIGIGDLNGDSVQFESLYSASGPTFPDGYDPADLALEVAGSAGLTFTGCDSAVLDFAVPALAADPGSVTIVRDIGVGGTECLLAQ